MSDDITEYMRIAVEEYRANLRAKVEALPFNPEVGAGGYVLGHWIRRADVLALFDGEQ